ncbi:hypothetical protein [Clostridium sp. DL1XJH146]
MKNSNGREASYAIAELVSNIVEGKITKKLTEKELIKIQKKYEEPFMIYEPDRKEKPWDINYLNELKKAVPFGATSSEYILYMAEVADEIYKNKRLIKNILYIVGVISGIAIILSLIKYID